MNNSNMIDKLKTQPKASSPAIPLGNNIVSQAATTSRSIVNQVANAGTSQQAAAINNQVQQLALQLANQMISEQQQLQIISRNGRTFTQFDFANDIVSNQIETVTGGLWSDNVANLTTYFTSSAQTDSQRKYYVDVLQSNPTADGAAVQYSIAFGHSLGSGSDSQGQLNDSPSKAIYSQYRQLLLNPNDSRFTTAGSGSTDYIYAVNFKRNRIKEKLDSGNFEIPLVNISSRSINATGSVTIGTSVYTLIDDSSIASASSTSAGTVYNIVSGSINDGVYNPTAPVYYGLSYPDYGTVILDGNMLDQQLGFATVTGSSVEGNNHFVLHHSISGSAGFTNPVTTDPYGFLARNSEKITSTHYFVRIKNAEYNFSNNPSYVTGSVGQLSQSSFVGDPKTYITTVGLYSDRQELLAVAKLSKPLLKSFQREALIRVKLDF